MLKIKDIIAVGALAIVSFPMVLLGVLLWTGNVRLVFGPESQDPNARGRLLERPEDIPGATKAPEPGKVAAGQTDSALMVRTADLDRREAEALQESQRVQALQQDDQKIRDGKLEAARIIEEARTEASRLREGILQQSHDEAREQKERALQEIELAREDAERALRAQVVSLSFSIADSILKRETGTADNKALVEEFADKLISAGTAGPSRN